eukprot:gene53610-38026_t
MKRAFANLCAAFMASNKVELTAGGAPKAPSGPRCASFASAIIETLDDEEAGYREVTANTFKWSVVGCRFNGEDDHLYSFPQLGGKAIRLCFAHYLGKLDDTQEAHPGLPWYEMSAEEILDVKKRRGRKRTMFGKSSAAFTKADNDKLKAGLKPPPEEKFDRREFCSSLREKARKAKEECIAALGNKKSKNLREVYNYFMNRIVDARVGDVKAEVREEHDTDRDDMDELEIRQEAAERLKAKRGAEAGKKGGWKKIERDACEAGRNAKGNEGETQKSLFDYSNDTFRQGSLLCIGKAKEVDAAAKKEQEEKAKKKEAKGKAEGEAKNGGKEGKAAKKEQERKNAFERAKEEAEAARKAEAERKEANAAKANAGGKDGKAASKEAVIADQMLVVKKDGTTSRPLPAGEVAEVTCVVHGKLELCLRGGGAMCDRDLPAEDFRVALLCPQGHGLNYISGGQDMSFVCAQCKRKTGGDGDVYACMTCTPDFALCPDCAESALTKEKAKAKGEKKAEEKEKAEKAEKEKADKKKEKEEAEKRAKAEKEKKEKEENDKKKKEEAEKAKAEKEKAGKEKNEREKAEETCPLGHRLKTMTKADLKAEGHDATFQCDKCKEKPHNIVEATKRGAKVCVRADIDHDWGRCGKCAPEAQEAKPAAKAPEQGSFSAGHGKKAPKEEKGTEGGEGTEGREEEGAEGEDEGMTRRPTRRRTSRSRPHARHLTARALDTALAAPA